ncbi:endonuclease domain-containing protein [Breoghania sp. JC706]|uniref:endonuclease domain-containing protein n=1 Tax=Breoghania sp. JC706 TaxID=3117732 RepID=UPI00300AF2D3
MSPTRVSPPAISRARRLRREMTNGERRLWAALKAFRGLYGIHVRKQVPMGPYVADFAVHSARLVIEVDGDMHGEERQMERDRRRDVWFGENGYRTLRLSTGELAEAFEGCVEKILRELGVMP